MPITLDAISRRRFLSASVGGAAALLAARAGLLGAEATADPNCFALLADTHIHANREHVHATKICMWDHLQQIARQSTALSPRPSAALICGDCAYGKGLPEDYATLIEALEPFRRGGLAVHLALGNHDHRENFWRALPADAARQKQLDSHHLLMLPTPFANWFILDSLETTDKTPGLLGEKQLAFLAAALDASPDKPALVMVHHNPDERPTPSGLVDTAALLDVLLPRRQVKALFFGHTHVWANEQRDGLHLVNLPTTAYVFNKLQPAGWVEAHLLRDGATLKLHAVDAEHRLNGQVLELKWR